MKTIALHNLGCKVNSYEIDVMQQMLQNDGYKIVSFEQKADVYVVNTCSVTNVAEALKMIPVAPSGCEISFLAYNP